MNNQLGHLRAAIINSYKNLLNFPILEADLLLSGILKRDRAWILGHNDYRLTQEEHDLITQAVKRRLTREPLEYILGEKDFCGLPITVTEGCLVPRPETELLVQACLERFHSGPFMDWGTGTGCISLAILKQTQKSQALMVEKNPKSMVCAWKNLKKFDMLDRAALWHSRTPKDIPFKEKLNLIVSNPPYIPTSQLPSLMPEVGQYEPHLALDGGESGVEPYRLLFQTASSWLKTGSYLCLEIGGDNQISPISQMAPSNFFMENPIRDFSNQARIICFKKTS